MPGDKSEILQGTLDLMVSKTLASSNNNRRAKFYSITKPGRRQLSAEARNGERVSKVIGLVLGTAERG
jgi:PadR family transcriptional regulator, regulatory protein PadR